MPPSPNLGRVLIPKPALARRVRELAAEIQADFAGREPIVIPILSGTFLFAADLVRHLNLPLQLDFLGVSSYGTNTRPGPLRVTKHLRLDIRGRDVLVVDDILDTGQTLAHVRHMLRALRPRSLRICVLLEKQVRRRTRLRPDYVGFRIPDAFVVGYGLDFAERFRNLPCIRIVGSCPAIPGPALVKRSLRPASPHPSKRPASAPGTASPRAGAPSPPRPAQP